MKKRLTYVNFFTMTDIIYNSIKVSLVFWLYLIKTGVIFKFIPLCQSLFFASKNILIGDSESVLKDIRDNIKNDLVLKQLNVISVIGLIYFSTFILLPFPDTVSLNVVVIIKIISIYMIAILIIFSVYGSLFAREDNIKTWYEFLLQANQFLVINLFRNLIFLFCLFFLLYFSFKNLIFSIFFFPGITSLIANWCYKSVFHQIKQ